MIGREELIAMISLLDDPDEFVVNTVKERLFSEGGSVLASIEEIWFENQFPHLEKDISAILKQISKKDLIEDLRSWWKHENGDLLEGWWIVTRTRYPGLKLQQVKQQINELRLECWYRMGNLHRKSDQLQVVNHVLYDLHRFKGNSENYHKPENSYINCVLDTHSGNPISLSVLYVLICQSLGLPIYGVNLPQHFVVALCESNSEKLPRLGIEKNFQILNEQKEEVGEPIFYINPYNKGQIFTRDNISSFLKVIGIEAHEDFYRPCNNKDIIKRMLRNLHFAYKQQEQNEEVELLEEMMVICGMEDEFPN